MDERERNAQIWISSKSLSDAIHLRLAGDAESLDCDERAPSGIVRRNWGPPRSLPAGARGRSAHPVSPCEEHQVSWIERHTEDGQIAHSDGNDFHPGINAEILRSRSDGHVFIARFLYRGNKQCPTAS